MSKINVIMLIIATISLLTSAWFAYLFYTMFWQWRDLFDETGRYFSALDLVVYHSEAKFYALPCVFFFLIAAELFKRFYEELK